MPLPQLHVQGGKIVDATGHKVYLRGLNTAGLEFGDGIGSFTQARINAFSQKLSMNLWRLNVNVSWWNNNVFMPDGTTHYRDWIQQVIGWMKAAGNYVEINPTNFATISPANSGPFCNNPPITTIASDTFTRANQSGWNPASDGENWIIGGVTPTLSITSNEGVLSGSAGSNAFMLLGVGTASDLKLEGRFALNNSSHVYSGVTFRNLDQNNCYIAYADTNNVYLAKRVAGVQTQLATVAKTITSGSFYNINVYANGTQITVVVWLDGTTIPNTYDIQTTDSSFASGRYGLFAFDTNASDSTKFDHFVVSTPQTACIISQNTQNFPPLTEAQMTAAIVQFFQSIVPIYASDPAILYDAWNEPGYFGGPATVADNNTIINAIRVLAPNSLIFVYDVGTNNLYPGASYSQSNIVLDFHVYDGNPTWQTQLAWWIPSVIAPGFATAIGEWNIGGVAAAQDFSAGVSNLACSSYGVSDVYYNADNLLTGDNTSLTSDGCLVANAFKAINCCSVCK